MSLTVNTCGHVYGGLWGLSLALEPRRQMRKYWFCFFKTDLFFSRLKKSSSVTKTFWAEWIQKLFDDLHNCVGSVRTSAPSAREYACAFLHSPLGVRCHVLYVGVCVNWRRQQTKQSPLG